MKQITINDYTFNYVIRRTTKKKIYIRVKENLVVISCTKKTNSTYIKQILSENIDFIKEQLSLTNKELVVHLNDKLYSLKLEKGVKSSIQIDENMICITAKNTEINSYKKVLDELYKFEINKELCKIIYEAEKSFPEVKMPNIIIRNMKRALGNYNRRKHLITLSTRLGKYDYKYIKFVLYHELSHVLEFNHSQKFYKVFESKYPNAKQITKVLKKIKYNDYI